MGGTDSLVHELAAGSVAGVAEYTFCQPVDVVLTRRILATTTTTATTATATATTTAATAAVGHAPSTGIVADMVALVKEGGWTRLYRGLGPQVLAAVPATIGMYVGERQFGRFFQQTESLSLLAQAGLAGFCSGFSETAFVCPFEVIKVRMQSKEHIGRYHGTFHCIRTVVREEGVRALYSGAPAMAARNCIFNGLFFSGSHWMRTHVYHVTGLESSAENFRIDLVCGFTMGALATPPKMPFMVAKTRLQGHGGGGGGGASSMGTFATMREIVRKEGACALWRGTQAAVLRMSLGSAVCLASFRAITSVE